MKEWGSHILVEWPSTKNEVVLKKEGVRAGGGGALRSMEKIGMDTMRVVLGSQKAMSEVFV